MNSLAPVFSRQRGAEFDQEAGIVPDIGDGLTPWLGSGLAHCGRSGFDGVLEKCWNIRCGQGDFDSQRRFVRSRCYDGLFHVLGCQREIGEGETRRAGLELAVRPSVVVLEKALDESKSLFLEGKAGGDIVYIQDHVAK